MTAYFVVNSCVISSASKTTLKVGLLDVDSRGIVAQISGCPPANQE